MTLRAWSLLTLVLAACGSISSASDAGGGDGPPGGDGSGGGDAAGTPDATPRFTRIVFAIRQGTHTDLYAVDVNDGAPGTPALLSGTPDNAAAELSIRAVAAGGDVVLYTSDARTDGTNELFLVRNVGGSWTGPFRLNGDHGGTGRYVGYAQISDDGTKVVYGWGQLGVFIFAPDDYYFVDVSGTPSTPVAVNGAGALSAGDLAPDGRHFAFVEANRVYAVDLTGAAPSAKVDLSGPGVSGTYPHAVVFSPTGTRLSYISDQTTNDVDEMWVADTSGATPATAVKASGPLGSGGNVLSGFLGLPIHVFSPDGRRLAYLADANNDGVNELFVNDLSGATPGNSHRANGNLVSGGAVADGSAGIIIIPPFAFSGDSKWLAYLADQRADEVFEVFLVDVSDATPAPEVRVSAALNTGGDCSGIGFSKAGNGLAYTADQRTDDVIELFWVDLSSGTPAAAQVVNGELGANEDVYQIIGLDARFSPDGTKIAYTSDESADTRNEVHLVDLSSGTPGTPHLMQAATMTPSTVSSMAFSADSTSFVYVSNELGANAAWLSDLGGATPTPVEKVNSVESDPPGAGLTVFLAP